MLTWQYPWFFALLPLPFLVYWLTPATKQVSAALRLPFFDRISETSTRKSTHPKTTLTLWFAFLIWALLITASCNPTWSGKPIQMDRSGRDLMLAIDISQSMELPDMRLNNREVDRLTALKHVATEFITARKGDRLGMILFGSRAYLQTPLTFDWRTIQFMLDDASIGLAGPRTAIGDAIGLSIKYLKELHGSNQVLILLTDGANNSGQVLPLDAAELARQLGIKIYTIGLGSDGMVINGFLGPQTINTSDDLDETTLKEIAEMTGGHYFRAKDTAGLAEIYDYINQLEPLSRDTLTMRPQTALYPIPLGIALLLNLLRHILRRYTSRRTNKLQEVPA